MTQDEIIRMAIDAGFETEDWANGTHVIVYDSGREIDITNELERFAALVAAHEKKFWMEQIEVECNEAVLAEREACANVCEEIDNNMKASWKRNAVNCAAAIRARSEK